MDPSQSEPGWPRIGKSPGRGQALLRDAGRSGRFYCAIAGLLVASAAASLHANPVLKGDFPDPSLIRLKGDYWATATSGEWAPIFPLLHSRNLVDWQPRGAVFAAAPAWTAGEYWAPELTEEPASGPGADRYRVYYTAHKKQGPLCVAVATAPAPAGPYTDHGPLVCQDGGSIDASTVHDEGSRLYLLWKEDGNSRNQPTPIWAQPLSPDGTRLLGTRRELLRNDAAWEGPLIEGPFALRRAGWFYLFYSGNACCGRQCRYALGVARARKLLGPWEKSPHNPILAGNAAWRCPGHGTVVTDERGRSFLLYHAYAARDTVYVGRQGLLDEVTWSADGWPRINDGKGPSGRTVAPLSQPGVRESDTVATVLADFTAPQLQPEWQWPAADPPAVRVEPAHGGAVELRPGPRHTAPVGELPGAILARRLVSGDSLALAELATDLPAGVLAGLAACGDPDNALGIAVGNGAATVWQRQQGAVRVVAASGLRLPQGSPLLLRMRVTDGTRYDFAVGAKEGELVPVGATLDGAYLPPWDRGVRVALTAAGPGPARFHWLRLTELRP